MFSGLEGEDEEEEVEEEEVEEVRGEEEGGLAGSGAPLDAPSAATDTWRRRSGSQREFQMNPEEMFLREDEQTWKRPRVKPAAGAWARLPPCTVSGLRALLSSASRLPRGCCDCGAQTTLIRHVKSLLNTNETLEEKTSPGVVQESGARGPREA